MKLNILDQLKKFKAQSIILLYFILNLFFLKNFPFVHSDEAWLSGLSRQIMETGVLASTESFFDLMPRHPHALKILFHLLQIVFIKIWGYQIFTFRLISLICGGLAAYFFYKIVFLITKSEKTSLFFLLVLLLDIQFIYSSHLARQEAVLLFIFTAAFYYFLKHNSQNIYHNFILGLITALSIGFHPNSFIIAMPFILIYTYKFLTKKISYKNYLVFAGILTLSASFFVFLSFQFDQNFIKHYSEYGSQLGVLDSLTVKLENLKNFYLKIFYQISGTYYLPPVKFQLIFFTLIFVSSLTKLFIKKDKINFYLLASLIAVNTAYLIIGRYNQTSIIFIFPIFYLLFINLIKNLDSKIKISLIILLLSVLTFNTANTLVEDSSFSYDNYLNEIAEVVEKDEKVLANLNTDYYFNNGTLYDYRNLAYLEENNLTFKEYLEKNKIKFIIYPEEMDFIYNSRPKWNILYGNLYPYYSEMNQFIKEKTTLVKEFSSRDYGIRITSKIDEKDWQVRIYKVNN